MNHDPVGLPAILGTYDVLVVGSGVAGLSVAQRLATAGKRVGLVTKDCLADSATNTAQGGIAVAFELSEDSPSLHCKDTLAAGAQHCDEQAVRVLVQEGPRRVRELLSLGACFDVDDNGALERSREGGHSVARVVHAGGAATGAEIVRSLVKAVRETGVVVLEGWFAIDLIVEGTHVTGLSVINPDGLHGELRSSVVILATGGAGNLFPLTTSPAQSTGDGIAMALRAGVPVADIEFVQFHPTALAVASVPRPLLSEALRGEGALLVDGSGRRFVDELAPRDVVSRAMAELMSAQGVDHLYLDLRPIANFSNRFSSLAQAIASAGVDRGAGPVPVAPAAHYFCGGVLVDLDGFTALDGLCAIGEVACNGVHGANRLASNSLLDGLVGAARTAQAILAGVVCARPTGVFSKSDGQSINPDLIGLSYLPTMDLAFAPLTQVDHNGWQRLAGQMPSASDNDDDKVQLAGLVGSLRGVMGSKASVVREGKGLADAVGSIATMATSTAWIKDKQDVEAANLIDVGRALVASALTREESRGAHTRSDFYEPRSVWRVRLVHGNRDLVDAIIAKESSLNA